VREITHPSLRQRVGEWAYLVAIALVALTVGAVALVVAPTGEAGMDAGRMGATDGEMAMPAAVPAAVAGVGVRVEVPAAVQPGIPARVTYRLTDAATGAPLTDVVVAHEAPMHLIAVSRDLVQFQHIHPAPTGQPGEFAVEVAFPTAGSYLLYSEFTRAGGQDIVHQHVIAVGTASPTAAQLAEERAPKVLGDIRVALQGAGTIVAGQAARLTFRLEEARTGEGIRDLRPYLGEPAHAVILSEDAQTFVHTHGEPVGAGAVGHGAAAGGVYGPEIAIHHTFPAPGLYKVWGQFQTRDGRVITADFVVRAQ
jgi:Cu+-exporting ATPase